MQAAHLSFQEYFVACAIRERAWRLRSDPWEFSPFWANTLKMGSEMGDAFGRGLLRAAGMEGDALDLSLKLGGDRPTALAAVAQLARGLTSLK